MLRILLVEDSRDDADLVGFQLEELGVPFVLRQVRDERQLREALETFEPGLAISDLNLPGYSGVAALELLHARMPTLPLVLLTGEADAEPPAALPVAMLGKDRLDRLPALLARLLAPA